MNIDKDLSLAARLQKNLLPKIPEAAFWNIDYFFRPCAVVSGDFLDLYTFGDVFFDDLENSDEQVGVVLLDAAGHGISAALISAIARPIFFKAHRTAKDASLALAMHEANIELIDQIGDASTYMTGASIRLAADHIAYTNASHPLILFYRAQTKQVLKLPNDAMFLGNRIARGSLKVRKVKVEAGDIILVYTDGLSEGENEKKQQFEAREIAKVMAKSADSSVAEIKNAICNGAQSFGYDFATATDDITFLIAKKN